MGVRKIMAAATQHVTIAAPIVGRSTFCCTSTKYYTSHVIPGVIQLCCGAKTILCCSARLTSGEVIETPGYPPVPTKLLDKHTTPDSMYQYKAACKWLCTQFSIILAPVLKQPKR